VPHTPVFLTIVLWIVSFAELDSAFHGRGFDLTNVGIVFYLDLLSTFIAWLLFIIFAFSSWPILNSPRAPTPPVAGRPGPPGSAAARALVLASPPPTGLSGMDAKRFGRSPGASPQPAVATENSSL